MGHHERKKIKLPTLPIDVIGEILSRMPPREAMQMSCVCKNLRDLLNSPSFLSLHFQNYTRKGGKHRLCKFTDDVSLVDQIHVCENGQPHDDFTSIITCRCRISARFTIVGTINGVVCIAYYQMTGAESAFIWNPIVQRKLTIPARQEFAKSLNKDRPIIEGLGFGYDSATNDYKVFSIVSELEPHGAVIVGPLKFDVWSSNNRERTNVELPNGLHIALLNRMHGAFVHGFCHWPVIRQQPNDKRICVLSVSASDYSVGMYELPEVIVDRMVLACNMAAIDGRLGFIPHDEIEREFAVVWVMREYGDAHSWMIRYRIEREGDGIPVLMWRSGVIMDSNMTAFFEGGGEDVQEVKLIEDETHMNRFVESFVFFREGLPCHALCDLEL